MFQIIGKGGFGREVSAYANAFSMEHFSFENECPNIRTDVGTVIAIGDPKTKERVFENFKRLIYVNINFGKSYSDSNAMLPGSIICPGTILTTNVLVMSHVHINLNCTIGHDVVIGEFTTISPGVNVSGNVCIGNRCYIGSNASIREGINICNDVIIGAGAVVVKDITEPGVYIGAPAIELHTWRRGIEELADIKQSYPKNLENVSKLIELDSRLIGRIENIEKEMNYIQQPKREFIIDSKPQSKDKKKE